MTLVFHSIPFFFFLNAFQCSGESLSLFILVPWMVFGLLYCYLIDLLYLVLAYTVSFVKWVSFRLIFFLPGGYGGLMLENRGVY